VGDANRIIGFVIIVVLYLSIGIMAAAGCVAIGRRFLRPKLEQVFYALFLMMIAAFYLAFTAYFQIGTAWRMESLAVIAFVAVGAAGARVPAALILGYAAHGLWDLLHELQQHGVAFVFAAGDVTTVPLAYGAFCAAFDLYIAVYAYLRRPVWNAAWRSHD
jgi:hypothetical protein